MPTPKFVYRVDRRSPEEVFRDGFHPWGTKRDFLDHISGGTLEHAQSASADEVDGFVSTSGDFTGAVRFFASSLTTRSLVTPRVWLYRIRATDNLYSAALTAQNLLRQINNHNVVFEQGNAEEAIDIINDVLYGVSFYHNEFFSDGPIPTETIQFARQLEAVPVDTEGSFGPDLINPTNLPLVYNVLANPEMHHNPHYVSANTEANHYPWSPSSEPVVSLHLSVPENTYLSQVFGGVTAALGFACESMGPNRNANAQTSLSCFTPLEISKYNNHQSIKAKTKTLSSYLYLKTQTSAQVYLLTNRTNTSLVSEKVILVDSKKSVQAQPLVFDLHDRIAWKYDPITGINFCLAISETHDRSLWHLKMQVAVTNSAKQKWKISHFKNNLYRIETEAVKHFVLVLNTLTHKLALVHKDRIPKDYQELFIVISKAYTKNTFLLKQAPSTQLLNLRLSWETDNVNYRIIPETGWSEQGKTSDQRFFYDLQTKKILYITNVYKEIFALKNSRTKNENWNWVKWIQSHNLEDHDWSLKWIFDTPPDIKKELWNYRRIHALSNNDLLWVTVRGTKWGALFTGRQNQGQVNSLAYFVVDKDFPL